MTDPIAIGVDIGGTKIALAVVDHYGSTLISDRLSNADYDGSDALIAQIGATVNRLAQVAGRPVAGVGVGSPGRLTPQSGVIHSASNMGWFEFPLLDALRAHLDQPYPLWLQKDANAAALAESQFGAAVDYDDFVLITIGTGLGGGAIVEGKILNGGDNYAMEIGHMPLSPEGRRCVCGMYGCPEMYVSGVGLLAGAREYLPNYPASVLTDANPITTRHILDAYDKNDPLALRLVDELKDWLATVIIACMGILNPNAFVIGGGLGHALYDRVAGDLPGILHRRAPLAAYRKTPILKSQVHDSAVGPACLVWQTVEES